MMLTKIHNIWALELEGVRACHIIEEHPEKKWWRRHTGWPVKIRTTVFMKDRESWIEYTAYDQKDLDGFRKQSKSQMDKIIKAVNKK